MQKAGDFEAMPKKEALRHTRELEKLQRNLGGIRGLDQLPDAIFVIDTKKEHIAVTEANKLGPADRGGGGHQLRSGRDHLCHPGQRRCHPVGGPAVPGGGRRRGRGPVHRPAATGPARPPPRPRAAPPLRRSGRAAPAGRPAPATPPAPGRGHAEPAPNAAAPRPPTGRPPRPPPRPGPGCGSPGSTGSPSRLRLRHRSRPAVDAPAEEPTRPGDAGPEPHRAARDRGGLTVPDFSAKDVQKLRQLTGVGMLDAKTRPRRERRGHRQGRQMAPRAGPGQPGQAGRP